MLKDKLGTCADGLLKKKLYLFDMDGTIYNENDRFDGTLELLQLIRDIGGRYVFITNNSSKSVADYIDKVRKMDIPADREDFYTSSQASAAYIKEHFPGQKVYCMGTRSLVEELKENGIDTVTCVDPEAKVVLIGFDTENTSEKIRNTCIMLNRDVAYIATNPDYVCPVSFGYIPDCGSMSIMLHYATGKKPFFIGKPQPFMIDFAVKNSGFSKEETVVIGDRLYTDIASGFNAGVDTICVLSGEAAMKDIEASDVKPTYVFQDVKEIYQMLQDAVLS